MSRPLPSPDPPNRAGLVAVQVVGIGQHPHCADQIIVGEDRLRWWNFRAGEESLCLRVEDEDIARPVRLVLAAGLIFQNHIGQRRDFLARGIER
jgi:hypothetical protein